MIMAVGLTVSKIGKGQRSERSGYNEIDYNSLKYNLGVLLKLNAYEMACLAGGLLSPRASSFNIQYVSN